MNPKILYDWGSLKMNQAVTGLLIIMWCIGVLCVSDVDGCGRGSVYLYDNGYRQILVAIADDIPEDAALVTKVKDVMTASSALLYKVTRQRAYYHDVTILIPDTWPERPDYETAGIENFDKSDVVIATPDIRFGGTNRPFTIQTTPCGELGHYMHLTRDYLMDADVAEQYGAYDKTFVHEWSHLRFGVFDEYPDENNGVNFYAGASGAIEATRCPQILTGTPYDVANGDDRCGYVGSLPDDNCRFRDDVMSGKFASLMYKQELDHIVEFCDDNNTSPETLHNPEAPNKHNQMCGGRSVWEVLRDHEDFKQGRNPPRLISDTTPIFRVVRRRVRRTVLVLDISGSMGPNNPGSKLAKLGQGCSNFITSIVQEGEFLGIVWFNGTGYPVKGLTEINQAARATMLQYIPKDAGGSTTIGGGIREGLNILRAHGTTSGGVLVVVSDGVETRAPWIADVGFEVAESNITVHSIAITNKADSKMDALAQSTGGLSFLYSANDNSNALNEAFGAIGELNQNPTDRRYTVYSQADLLPTSGSITGSFVIDSSLARDVVITIDYSGSDVGIVLTSSGGTSYDTTSSICVHDSTFGIYRFTITRVSEYGGWNYVVTNPEANVQTVAVSVSGKSTNAGDYPIVTSTFWGKRTVSAIAPGPDPVKQILYATVSKGYIPVLNATVIATVERPTGNVVDVLLKDDGAGSDVSQDDGVYSAYFIDINAAGRYNVKVMVNSKAATIISARRIIGQGASSLPVVGDVLPDVPTGEFQRVATGGSFELSSYTAGSGKLYLPGRVKDLRVLLTDTARRQVTLQWTAVGDQLDRGQVSDYIVRYGSDFAAMRTNFSSQLRVTSDMVVSGNMSQPQTAGNLESLTVTVPEKGDVTYIFAMVARDLDGRDVTGPMSNVVTASMKEAPQYSNRGDVIAAVILGAMLSACGCLFVVTVLVTITLLIMGKKTVSHVSGTSSSVAHVGYLMPIENRSTFPEVQIDVHKKKNKTTRKHREHSRRSRRADLPNLRQGDLNPRTVVSLD